MKATLAGLCFLALVTAALACLVPANQVPHFMWFFVYLMLASIAVFAWRHSEAPSSPSGWLKLVLWAAVLGAFLAGAESLVFGPKSGLVLFDIAAAAAGVLVACSGAVYAAAKGKQSQ